MKTDHFFASCPRGLETVLASELDTLGAQYIEPTDGGVVFAGDFSLMMRVNLHSRYASRVLWRIVQGRFRHEQDIYRLAHDVDWAMLFDVQRTIKVSTTAVKSEVRSTEFVSLKIKDAICDRFRALNNRRPNVDTAAPDMRIHVFLMGNDITLYLDTSGDALFKRGVRVASNEAPIRENLAAGILALAGWTPGTPLFDPMCGSGTFLIEAAEMTLKRAPGQRRHFAFEQFNGFAAARWQALRDEAKAAELPASPLPIWGSDIDAYALDAAYQNLSHSGLDACISLTEANMLDTSAPAANGIVVSNPPYGIRMDEQDRLAALYPELGHWLKQKMTGWNAYFVTADLRLAKLIRLSASKRTPLFNGALECRLFEYRMVAGSRRERPPKETP